MLNKRNCKHGSRHWLKHINRDTLLYSKGLSAQLCYTILPSIAAPLKGLVQRKGIGADLKVEEAGVFNPLAPDDK